jgi:uncharacterized iron-regulated protein
LQRDRVLRAGLALAAVFAACASGPRPEPFEQRLRGDAIVLLGEVHDNAEQHRLRLALLRRAFAAGWRPAIAMEQLDRERQADVERARRERPGDAQHVIDVAAARPSGWSWDSYRPFVALALEYDVALIAANLSSADAKRIVRGGYAGVFDAASLARLGLDRPITADWQAAQEREIDAGHCHALPQSSWPALARVQFARDAVMAAVLREHSAGVVLLAGNGHVRRDLGVPRWLSAADQSRVFSVGFVEEGDPEGLAEAFDAVVRTARAERGDPCAAFESPGGHKHAPGLSERQGLPVSPRSPGGFAISLEALACAGI